MSNGVVGLWFCIQELLTNESNSKAIFFCVSATVCERMNPSVLSSRKVRPFMSCMMACKKAHTGQFTEVLFSVWLLEVE